MGNQLFSPHGRAAAAAQANGPLGRGPRAGPGGSAARLAGGGLGPDPRFAIAPEPVGREPELRVLAGAIAALDESEGASLLVSGEPGIGKTRLLRAAADDAAADGLAVAWGHIWADVGAPALWPWIQILRTIAVDVAELEPVRVGPGAPHLAGLVPELADVLADRDDFDDDVEHADFYLRDAVVTLVCAAARRQPRVILLDDLHRADVASLHLAEQLMQATRGTPICLIGSRRDEATTDERGAVLARLRAGSQELALDGLTPDECREFTRARLGRPVSAAEGRTLFERSGGNPLFLEEVLQGGFDRPGVAVAPARSVLWERLERLDPVDRNLLEIASVAGVVFSVEYLATVAGADSSAVEFSVAALVDAGLVEHRSEGNVAFRHALVAEAAYDRLDPAWSAELHRAWAATLIDTWSRAADYPGVIAGHLLAAIPLAAPAEARRWTARAARAATDRLAHDDAAAWYEQALRACSADDTDDVERCDLLLAFGQALLHGTGTVRAMAAFGEAVAAAERADDAVRRLDALTWLTEARYRAPGIHLDDAGRGTLTSALESSSGAPPALAARAAEQLARLESFRGSSERAYAVAQRALAAARKSGDAEAVSAAQRALRRALVGPFSLDEKREASHLLVSGLSHRSHPEEWWAAYTWRLLDALERGDRASIDAELQSCRRLADELREPYLSSLTATWESAVALLEGRYDEAEHMITAVLAAAESYGVNTGGLHAQLTCLAWGRGETESFTEVLRGITEVVPNRSSLYRAILANLYGEQGRLEEATFELDHLAVDDFSHVPRDEDWLTTLTQCALAGSRLNRADIALPLRTLLLPFRDRAVVAGGHPFLFLGAVTHFTGALAVAAGDPVAALEDLADALAFHQRMHARPWVAYTLLEQGRAYLARGTAGDAEEAATAFAAAQFEADALGMAALSARAAQLAGERPSFRPTLAPQGRGWEVAFSAGPFHLHDSKGLRCLQHLLDRPGVKVPAAELVADVLGEQAADSERARVNVTRQLRSAIDRIGEHDRDLADHLRRALSTGRECCYRPAGAPPAWRLR